MKKWKKLASGSVLLAGLAYAVTAYAYPMPGYNQEVYVTYYSDASLTVEVGVQMVAKDAACTGWHANWGTTSPHRFVTVSDCP